MNTFTKCTKNLTVLPLNIKNLTVFYGHIFAGLLFASTAYAGEFGNYY